MNIKYDGYNTHCLTMENGGVTPGNPVSIDAKGRAINGAVGKPFVGMCVSTRGDYAVVQTHGYAKANCVDKLAYGINELTVTQGNKLGLAIGETEGRQVIVVEVDSVNQTIGFIL